MVHYFIGPLSNKYLINIYFKGDQKQEWHATTVFKGVKLQLLHFTSHSYSLAKKHSDN